VNITYEEALSNIHPLVSELTSVITASHLIDDYLTSRNIARYGLKFTALMDVCVRLKVPGHFWHQYTMEPDKKVVMMQGMLGAGYTDDEGHQIKGWGLL
jgi:hypothetical protein